MYWQKMAEQMAEQVVAIQNAAEESDCHCDSDCDLLVLRPSANQTSEARV